MILDGARIAARMPTPPIDLRAYLLAFYPLARIASTRHVNRSAVPMTARINHGVWIASCECGAEGHPSPGCVVYLDNPIGWCVRCGNRAHGGMWRPIMVPGADERAAIEAVLLCRPSLSDRNWQPGETVDELIAQNLAHGDPIPEVV
jgi:hypothetical protein